MSALPVIVQTTSVPNTNRLNVVVHISADVIAPDVARKRANGWLVDHVGNLVHAEDPELVAAERIRWRLKVVLTSAIRGAIGALGTLDLDAESGDVLADELVIQQLHAHAAQIAQR